MFVFVLVVVLVLVVVFVGLCRTLLLLLMLSSIVVLQRGCGVCFPCSSGIVFLFWRNDGIAVLCICALE